TDTGAELEVHDCILISFPVSKKKEKNEYGRRGYVLQSPELLKARVAVSIEESSIATASMSSPRPTQSKTAREIRDIIDALEFDDIASYFEQDDDEIDPYVVCDGVSVGAFNRYIGDGERLRFALRFLQLSDDGRILIVDLSTTVHESTVQCFEFEFLTATGNGRLVKIGGSTTVSRVGLPKKEADDTYGPLRSTPNRTRPPRPRIIADWVTLAVEVGRAQTWASLETAAQWWCGYAGIQYILLLKVSRPGTQITYRLYEINIPQCLPPPSATGIIRRRNRPRPADSVTFNMRRILSIPANQPLPNGLNPNAVVDLRIVMEQVIDTI
ncbi:hypothetical protein F441_22031, partial [Phytophthora nicotianae CJ01A1]